MQNIDLPFENYDFNSASILDDLPKEDLALLNKNAVTHSYRRGDMVFREGSIPTGIYFLKKGKIKKYKTDKDGREQIFYVCKSGELLGYHALICEEKYTDSASVIEESQITFIPKEDFLRTVQSSTVLSNRLLRCMGHEFGVLVNSLAVYAQRTVRERLALSLLILRDKYKKDQNETTPVELLLSREDLSKMVGTARETVTRLLHDFKAEGLIAIEGRKIMLKKPVDLSRIANLF
jgi:CRP-like cAMP-binding protein